ncbi:UDP-4-amino-4,6-dideoxy-N-acetyl-beta-L-altrosamine N-acetyltransferase [Legionella jamestowniensis]|nr:UDP-4-amino-4,6-dideoxy-N-acetyl-beta-L-altrosamine N-acetyltransferase [Legionella jamestowniensis]
MNKASKVRLMTEDDLLQVLGWRNHPEIRRFMYTTHEITMKEHINWFERESKNKNKVLLIFESNQTPSGFVSFNILQSKSTAEWGFYIAPEAPKGTGLLLGCSAIDYLFYELNLHKLMGHVLESNKKSLNFHEKLGFMQEGIFREHYFDGSIYRDVIYFGLLRQEWMIRKERS